MNSAHLLVCSRNQSIEKVQCLTHVHTFQNLFIQKTEEINFSLYQLFKTLQHCTSMVRYGNMISCKVHELSYDIPLLHLGKRKVQNCDNVKLSVSATDPNLLQLYMCLIKCLEFREPAFIQCKILTHYLGNR